MSNTLHERAVATESMSIWAGTLDMEAMKAILKDFNYYNSRNVCGALVQYPKIKGEVWDFFDFIRNAHAKVSRLAWSHLLSLKRSKSLGEFKAYMDIEFA